MLLYFLFLPLPPRKSWGEGGRERTVQRTHKSVGFEFFLVFLFLKKGFMFKRGRYKEKSCVQIVTDSKPLDPLNTINTIQST